ncbi:EAL domain-containing protein [Desulfoplanes sp.]
MIVFVAAIIPIEQKALVTNLDSQSKNLSAAIKETILSALISDDVASVVEQCFSIVSRRDSIAYIVISKKDQDSIVFLHDRWFMEANDPCASLQRTPEDTGRFIHSSIVDAEVYHYTSTLSQLGLDLGKLSIGLKPDAYYSAQNQMYMATWLTALGVLFFGFLLSALVSRKIVNPILALERFVRVSIAGGFNGKRVTISSNDEIQGLAETFNAMVESIEDSQRKLREAHDTLEERVEIRTQQLSSANRQLNLMHEMFNCCREGICITNADGCIELLNPAFPRLMGLSREELEGKDPLHLLAGGGSALDADAVWKTIRSQGVWEGNASNVSGDAPLRAFHMSVSTIRDARGRISHHVFILRDVSELKAKEELIQHQAYHDSLTGLPNRKFISEHIRSLVDAGKDSSRKLAVFFIDLDNFKHVNDNYGHKSGDLVLQEVSKRLKRSLRGNDLVGRLGGDEFIVVLGNVAKRKIVSLMIDKLMAVFDTDFALSDTVTVNLSMSCGIAVFPDDGTSLDQLLANSDMAMYKAKSQGKKQVAFYDYEMHERVRNEYTLEQQLKTAIANDDLLLHFQPIFTMAGKIARIEALVRWRTAGGDLIPPGEFIPVAEKSDLINDITRIVVRKGFDQLALWQAEGWSGVLSVNLSTRSLYSQDIVDFIITSARERHIDIKHVELEVTETSMMYDIETARSIIEKFCGAGFSIALDDFGTGYSSLRYLEELPYHTLKIDKFFVDGLLDPENRSPIVASIISLARGLNREVIAEGVETKTQAVMLSDMDCHYLQGFYLSKPLPEKDMTTMLTLSKGLTLEQIHAMPIDSVHGSPHAQA